MIGVAINTDIAAINSTSLLFPSSDFPATKRIKCIQKINVGSYIITCCRTITNANINCWWKYDIISIMLCNIHRFVFIENSLQIECNFNQIRCCADHRLNRNNQRQFGISVVEFKKSWGRNIICICWKYVRMIILSHWTGMWWNLPNCLRLWMTASKFTAYWFLIMLSVETIKVIESLSL